EVSQNPGEPLDLVVERGGRRLAIPAVAAAREVSDRFGNTQKIGYLGIGPARVERVRVGPVGAVVEAVDQTRGIIGM
ncbi:hypothetical protein ABTM77_21445, partial [Acinetobacter baumannii]